MKECGDTYIRNLEIYRKHAEEKTTYDKLAAEYGVTRERIRQICAKMKRIKENESKASTTTVNEVPRIREYVLDRYHERVQSGVISRAINAILVHMSCNAVCKSIVPNLSYCSDPTVEEFMAMLDAIPENEMPYVRNLGRKSAMFLEMIKTDYKEAVQNGRTPIQTHGGERDKDAEERGSEGGFVDQSGRGGGGAFAGGAQDDADRFGEESDAV